MWMNNCPFLAQIVTDQRGGVWGCQPGRGSGRELRIRICVLLSQCGQKWIHAGRKVGIRQTTREHKQERIKKVIFVVWLNDPDSDPDLDLNTRKGKEPRKLQLMVRIRPNLLENEGKKIVKLKKWQSFLFLNNLKKKNILIKEGTKK